MGLRSYVANLQRAFGATIAADQTFTWSSVATDEWGRQTPPADYLTVSPAVYMACRYRAQKVASVPLKFYRVGAGGKKIEAKGGTLTEIMAKVNPYWTAARLWEMTEMSLLLYGKSYWLLDSGQGGRREPKELWWLHPDNVKVVKGGDYVKLFEYDTGSGAPLQLDPKEVFWLRYPNPNNQWDGLAPLAAARIIAETSTEAMKSNARMFSQGMQLAGFVSPEDRNDTWTPEQGQQIESSLSRRFSGANKAHRWAVIGRQMKFSPLTVSPKDAEFLALLKWSFEDICRVFGLSPDLLGGERTYSNAAEARVAFWQDTMMPELSFLANELTEQVLPLFAGQADIAEFDLSGVDVLQDREAAKWAREKEQITTGAVLLNEWRTEKGMKPLAWGDAWWAPSSLIPVTTSDLPEPASAEPLPLPANTDPAATDGQSPQRMRMTRTVAFGSTEHERMWRAFVARTEPHEERFGAMCADLMRRQRRSVLSRLKDERGKREAKAVADDPFDKAKWVKEFRTQAKPVVLGIVQDAGDAAYAELSIEGSFDVKDPNVTRFITQRAQRFAVEVNETTYTALQDTLAEGVDAGESIDQLSARVETVMSGRIRSSASTIARTEVLSAYSGADNIAWAQSDVVAGSEWVAAIDERTREDHVAAHGQRRRLGEDFNVGGASGLGPGLMGDPAQDINCRCTRVAILDVDWTD